MFEATGKGSSTVKDSLFMRVYRHAFQLAISNEKPGAKVIPLETAKACWQTLLGPHSPGLSWIGKSRKTPWLDWWLEFLETKAKGVNKDLWIETLNFAEKSVTDEDLSFWSEDASWPGVIDEFAQEAKKRQANE